MDSNLLPSLVGLVTDLQEKSKKSPPPDPYDKILKQSLSSFRQILEQMEEMSLSKERFIPILRDLQRKLVAHIKSIALPRPMLSVLSFRSSPTYVDLINDIDDAHTQLTVELLNVVGSSISRRSSSDSAVQLNTPGRAGTARDDVNDEHSRVDTNGGHDHFEAFMGQNMQNGDVERERWEILYGKEKNLRTQKKLYRSLKETRKEALEFFKTSKRLYYDEEMLEFLLTVVSSQAETDYRDKLTASKTIQDIISKHSRARLGLASEKFREEFKSLILFLKDDQGCRTELIKLISVLCEGNDRKCQDAVVDSSGIEPLLLMVEDRKLTESEKKDAALVLADLASNANARLECVHKVDFIRRAIQFILRTEMLPVHVVLIRALVAIMDAEKTAVREVRLADGLRAFAEVLEDRDHKIAASDREIAAVALAKLVEEDPEEAKQNLGEKRLLSLLCNCLSPLCNSPGTARSHAVKVEVALETALKAISILVKEEACKRAIVQGAEFSSLLSTLTQAPTWRAKEFTLSALLELSRAHTDFVRTLSDNELWKTLLDVVRDPSSPSPAVDSAIRIVINLTRVDGVTAKMEANTTIKVLMDSIGRHGAETEVRYVAVLLLEKFAHPDYWAELLKESNVRLLVSVLKMWVGSERFESAVRILGKLASGSDDEKGFCKIMIEAGVLQPLKDIVIQSSTRLTSNTTTRLLTWVVNRSSRKADLDGIRRDDVVIRSIEMLKQSDGDWIAEAQRALQRLK